MENIFLGLGANMGNVMQNIEEALVEIQSAIGQIIARSSQYLTEPWGDENQAQYVNLVIQVQTALSASGVLNNILRIEKKLGRNRNSKNQFAPRTIDIDILFYGNQMINDENLVVPHPRLADRNFVLTPLMEIAPDFIHPSSNRKIKDLFKISTDTLKVIKI